MSSPFPPCPPIPQATGPVHLILPPTEDRPHQYFTLANGLEVIVVSDPQADKAAASMNVGVGHLSDPDDLAGCAHFCEHLLFMGTKSFPKENEYQGYLSSNNGHSNAYTGMTSTVYFFDVQGDALEGALDRFAGFFVEPLFNEDCTEREIKAVDSEHKKNLQNDMWRFFQTEKHICRSDHAYHKFGTGNYDTLWSKPKENGRDPRKQLIEWWEKEYCARRMKLAVVGKEDLETLEKWLRERFEKVPVRTEGHQAVGTDGIRVVFESNPIGEQQMRTATFTRPVQETRGLEITFPFPDIEHLYQSKPGSYIAHFIGHEGRGSLLSYLKKQGWSNALRAGLMHGAAGFEFVKITVDLTPSGLEHWEDVALAIFKYVNLLRDQPPSSEAFHEIQAIADISFQFREKAKSHHYCTALCNWMQSPFPREKIVSATSLLESFKPDELASALHLLDPRRATVGVTGRELPKNVEGTFDETEPIYGTQFKRIDLSERFIKEAVGGTPISDLRLPGKNLFIPEKLGVDKFEVKEPALRPAVLRDTSLSRLWYKRDDRFWLPKAMVNITLQSPLLDPTPRNAVLSRLLCDLFRDSITEDVYDASLAELDFNLQYSGDSIGIGAGGFSDKLAVLVETMLTKFMKFEIDEARFADVVDDIKLGWQNFPLSDPYRQAAHWDSYVKGQNVWTHDERLRELEFITPAQVADFGREVLSRTYIETLVHGNSTTEEALAMQDMLEKVLSSRSLTAAEKNNKRSYILPSPSDYVWSIDVPNKAEVNSSVYYYLHVGDPTDVPLRNQLELLGQIASEPTFDHLRTKEQLGYITSSSPSHRTGSIGFRVLVQSEKDPVYVETRIETFLDWLQGHVGGMSDEEFEKNKQSIISRREEKPKNLYAETKRFWGAIAGGYYEFGHRATDIAQLRKTTKSDILAFVNTYIHTSSPTRSKMSVHMKSQSTDTTPRFDLASAQPLIDAFTKHRVAVDQAALQTLMGSKPDVEAVKAFGHDAVAKSEGLDEVARKGLQTLIDGLKSSGGARSEAEKEAKLRKGNVYIEDVHRFKAGLIPSKAPVPLEPIRSTARL